MPGPRIEISQALVFHLIHLGEDLNSNAVRVHMIDCNIVTNVVSTWSPNKMEIVPGKVVADAVDLGPVLHFKSYVVEPLLLIGNKIDCMVIDGAAQEGKLVSAPIGDPETKFLCIEFHHSLDVVATISDMTQLEERKRRRPESATFWKIIVREDLQEGSLGIFEGHSVGDARGDASTPLDFQPVVLNDRSEFAKIAVRLHLEGESRQAHFVALFKHNGFQAGTGRKHSALFAPFDSPEFQALRCSIRAVSLYLES